MYCPLCGNKMEFIERNEEQRKIHHSKDEWDYTLDNSDWYYCPTKKCFGQDYPLVHHRAPIRKDEDIYYMRPGDSWSLTWLK